MNSRVNNCKLISHIWLFRKIFYCIVTLLIFNFANIKAINAQQPSQFGFINVADVMLLHPTMRYFDPTAKRFKLEALKGINTEKRAEENKSKFKSDLKKLEENVKELEAQRVELEETYNNQIGSIGSSDKNKYNEKKRKIEEKYRLDADNLRKKIYFAKQKIETFKSNSIYTGFTTQGETSKLFSVMLDDVYDAMGAVAKHYNVSFVFNSSAEISYIEGRMRSNNPMGDFFDNFDQKVQERDGKKIMGAAFYSWLGEKNSTFLNCNDRRLNSFVMLGGLNMTSAVIDYIYQKHKVGKAQRDFIVEYYGKIVNGK